MLLLRFAYFSETLKGVDPSALFPASMLVRKVIICPPLRIEIPVVLPVITESEIRAVAVDPNTPDQVQPSSMIAEHHTERHTLNHTARQRLRNDRTLTGPDITIAGQAFAVSGCRSRGCGCSGIMATVR